MNVVHLDVSELEAPDPYCMAVELLATLSHDSMLNMTHRKEPYPLYQAASEMGFFHQTTHLPHGGVQIQFWHRDNNEASQRYS